MLDKKRNDIEHVMNNERVACISEKGLNSCNKENIIGMERKPSTRVGINCDRM
jgi:hypothetical protein